MINLLVMSSERARQISALWNNQGLNITWMVLSLIALASFGLGLLGTIAAFMDFKKLKLLLPATLALFLMGCLLGVKTIHNTKIANTNMEAADNVIDYHKMKHLRKIYPKLPCKAHIKYKTCNSNSLSKVSKNKREAKHVLTRHEAVKKYNHYHSMYRSVNGDGTKDIHPYAPHWYNHI